MKLIRLTKGKFAKIDDEDYELISSFKWFANKVSSKSNKYRAIKNKDSRCRHIYMHRLLMGVKDKKILVDHIDHDPLNNQKHNLRVCDFRGNACNTTSSKNSTSKYLGVSLYKREQKYKTKTGVKISTYTSWRATIFKNYKQIYLGMFKTEKEAALAYNEAAKIYHGDFANLNII